MMAPEKSAAVRLLLPNAVRARIARLAGAAHPAEACGLLTGQWEETEAGLVARVSAVHDAVNLLAAERSDRFELDPAVRLRVQREARDGGYEVLGHWHSHPSGWATPSETDAARSFEGGLIWLIQATDPETGAPGALSAQVSTGLEGPPARAFRPLILAFFEGL